MKTSKQKLEELLMDKDIKQYLNEKSLATDLSVQFKMHRESCKLSQSDLAKMMGVQQSTVARLESGEVGINTATLQKFCTAMNLKLNFEKYKLVTKDSLSDPMDVIKYIVEFASNELKECYDITHLKLQKLLYYVQFHYIGQFSHPLIDHDFQAWEHGPVCPKIYDKFKIFHNKIILHNEVKGNVDNLNAFDKNMIEQFVVLYVKYSAWQLREKTHSEMPWKNAWGKGINTPISINDMKVFYDMSAVVE